MKKTSLVLSGIALAVSMTACASTSTGGSGSEPDYYETCQQLNRENPDFYEDPDLCASDAKQLAEDLRQYEETH